MPKTLGAQASEELYEEVEEWKEDSESMSPAVRRLIRAGLEAKSEEEQRERNDRRTLFVGTMVAGIAWATFYLLDEPIGTTVIGGTFIVAVLFWTIIPELERKL